MIFLPDFNYTEGPGRVLADDMTGPGDEEYFSKYSEEIPNTKALFPFRNAEMEELHNDVKI